MNYCKLYAFQDLAMFTPYIANIALFQTLDIPCLHELF